MQNIKLQNIIHTAYLSFPLKPSLQHSRFTLPIAVRLLSEFRGHAHIWVYSPITEDVQLPHPFAPAGQGPRVCSSFCCPFILLGKKLVIVAVAGGGEGNDTGASASFALMRPC